MNGSGWSVERHHWADCEEKNSLNLLTTLKNGGNRWWVMGV